PPARPPRAAERSASARPGPPPSVVVREVRRPVPVHGIYAAVRESAPERPALSAFVAALREAAAAARPDREAIRAAPSPQDVPRIRLAALARLGPGVDL
ncbi:hypothetical protein P1P75_28170, partial [Streptomyces sp. ID05-39B]|nr:hypothetical protein [Streptomyces sp. ID05-39B]